MIGKQPSVVAGGVGFIANRLQMAMFCEAARCVEEGLASPRDIDEVVRSCFGFRLPFFGPFQIADMAGLDVYEAVVEQHEQGLGERFRVPDSLRRLVARGTLRHRRGRRLLRLRARRRGPPPGRARPPLRLAERAARAPAAALLRRGEPAP